MDQIFTLVDFTETASLAIDQAIAIALQKKAAITICHVSPSVSEEDTEEVNDHLRPYVERVRAQGLEVKKVVGHGELFAEVQSIVARIRPDLVVVGTHGLKGIKQNLFGSNIYKLVKALPVPTLVVNDRIKSIKGGFDKVLVPVAPHPDYINKVENAAELMAKEGTIVLFAIIKPGVNLDEPTVANLEKSKKMLTGQGVKWEYVEEDAHSFSVGYSRDTIKYVSEHPVDLISIMADVSYQNSSFGKVDKENLLLNELGVPILCSNR